MANLLKPLSIVALTALAVPAFAQDAATPELDMGQSEAEAAAAPANQGVQLVVTEVFDDWSMECAKAAEGEEINPASCHMMQVLRENPEANPVGKISIARLPEAADADAYVEVVMPLGVVLPENLVIQVGTAQPRVYQYRFCLPVGCVARIGFTPAEVQAFKAGADAKIMVAAEGNPPTPVEVPVSLKGFTKAYDALTVPVPAAN